MPTVTDSGENPHWDSSEPYFDELYCNVKTPSLLAD